MRVADAKRVPCTHAMHMHHTQRSACTTHAMHALQAWCMAPCTCMHHAHACSSGEKEPRSAKSSAAATAATSGVGSVAPG